MVRRPPGNRISETFPSAPAVVLPTIAGMLRNLISTAIFSAAAALSCAQSHPGAVRYGRHNVAGILGFEVHGSGGLPAGWTGSPAGTVSIEGDVVRSGSRAVILDRSAHPSGSFSTMTATVPMDFTGERIELRGFLRTKDASGSAALWMREDRDGEMLEFGNTQRQQFAGTHGWQQFSINLPLNEDANHLRFGALLAGSGTAWVDDLQLLVDGKFIADAVERAPQTGHAFDQGSGISLTTLTPLQNENLAALGRVWGFLKYHDQVITTGKRR